MKYKARYGQVGYRMAIESAIEAISGDQYYAMYGGGGTGLLNREITSDRCWGDFYLTPGPLAPSGYKSPNIPDEGYIKTLPAVEWTASSGNVARFEFDHFGSKVILTVESRRHGIPLMAQDFFGVNPEEVLEYKTAEPAWKWWETADTVVHH